MANPNMQCHKMVRHYAKLTAEKLVEQLLRDPKWWKYYKELFPTFNTKQIENTLVIHVWPAFIDKAREMLAKSLKDPRLSEKDKEIIRDALVKDSNCGRGKVRVSPFPRPPTEMLN